MCIRDRCKKAGILTYAMFIVGFPGETAATIQQTINYINESGPDFYALSPWCYITSAPIHTQRLKYGLTGQNNHWRHNTMHSGEVQQYILNIYQHVYNSTLLAFNYTFLFQLLYHNVPLKKILEINKDKIKQILQSLSIAPI